MAKGGEARQRKNAAKNGAGSRGKGDAGKAARNGKARPKATDAVPMWQNVLGVVVIVGAVFAVAYMTGVVKIDRNLDGELKQDGETQPTVAEVNDPGKEVRKNATPGQKQPLTDTQDTWSESASEEPKPDTAKGREKVDSKSEGPAGGETPEKVKDTVESKDTVKAPQGDSTPNQESGGSTGEEKKEEKPAAEAKPGDASTRDKETLVQTESAKETIKDDKDKKRKPSEAKVEETTSPKGKKVTPKRTTRETKDDLKETSKDMKITETSETEPPPPPPPPAREQNAVKTKKPMLPPTDKQPGEETPKSAPPPPPPPANEQNDEKKKKPLPPSPVQEFQKMKDPVQQDKKTEEAPAKQTKPAPPPPLTEPSKEAGLKEKDTEKGKEKTTKQEKLAPPSPATEPPKETVKQEKPTDTPKATRRDKEQPAKKTKPEAPPPESDPPKESVPTEKPADSPKDNKKVKEEPAKQTKPVPPSSATELPKESMPELKPADTPKDTKKVKEEPAKKTKPLPPSPATELPKESVPEQKPADTPKESKKNKEVPAKQTEPPPPPATEPQKDSLPKQKPADTPKELEKHREVPAKEPKPAAPPPAAETPKESVPEQKPADTPKESKKVNEVPAKETKESPPPPARKPPKEQTKQAPPPPAGKPPKEEPKQAPPAPTSEPPKAKEPAQPEKSENSAAKLDVPPETKPPKTEEKVEAKKPSESTKEPAKPEEQPPPKATEKTPKDTPAPQSAKSTKPLQEERPSEIKTPSSPVAQSPSEAKESSEDKRGATQPDAKQGKSSKEEKKTEDSSKKSKDAVKVAPLDRKIDALLKEAEKLAEEKKVDQALYKYEAILEKYPDSPKARMGKAQMLDQLAEQRRSNDLLQKSIAAYRDAADAPKCPPHLRKGALDRLADRLSFLGKSRKSVSVYEELVRDFPDDYQAKRSLGVQYLIAGQNLKAKPFFEQLLEHNPQDGFALVHLGFIVKAEEQYHEAIPLLRAGLDTGDKGTNEGKFYFHLGDSHLRIGQPDEAYKVYDEGVRRGHFRSRYQRSLYNVDTLRAKPFWTPKDAGFAKAAKKLESNWEAIRDEALALLSDQGYFENEEEKLRETGDWKQFTLYARGAKNQANCKRAPVTCRIIDEIPQASGCRRGQVKFSVMHPGTHVWPHCGPTNCRLRSHLGLVVPQPVRLRVGNTTRSWDEGKLFIFDDSFEHEVWQEADSLRLILISDLWHPDLSESQKQRLTAI